MMLPRIDVRGRQGRELEDMLPRPGDPGRDVREPVAAIIERVRRDGEAALRLARFNTQVGKMDKRYFQGLPTPATALLISTAVLFHEDGGLQPISWLWFGISVVLAWLMVSRVRFVSGKEIDLKQRRPFVVVVAFLAVIFFVMINPYRMLFMLILAYVLHGVILSLWQKRRAFQMRTRLRQRRQKRREYVRHEEEAGQPPVEAEPVQPPAPEQPGEPGREGAAAQPPGGPEKPAH